MTQDEKIDNALATQRQVDRILSDAWLRIMHDSWRLSVQEAKERANRLLSVAA